MNRENMARSSDERQKGLRWAGEPVRVSERKPPLLFNKGGAKCKYTTCRSDYFHILMSSVLGLRTLSRFHMPLDMLIPANHEKVELVITTMYLSVFSAAVAVGCQIYLSINSLEATEYHFNKSAIIKSRAA